MICSWLRRIPWPALIGSLLVVLGCAGLQPQVTKPDDEGRQVPKQLQTRQVIVTLTPAFQEHWASITAALAQTYDLPQTGVFPLQSLGVRCVVFQIPQGRSVEDTLRRLSADPRVESVQLNQVFQGLGAVHNDPYATLQHGAHDIGADVAHHLATGKGVTIAVVDTGVETEHPDLHERVVRTANFVDAGEQTF